MKNITSFREAFTHFMAEAKAKEKDTTPNLEVSGSGDLAAAISAQVAAMVKKQLKAAGHPNSSNSNGKGKFWCDKCGRFNWTHDSNSHKSREELNARSNKPSRDNYHLLAGKTEADGKSSQYFSRAEVSAAGKHEPFERILLDILWDSGADLSGLKRKFVRQLQARMFPHKAPIMVTSWSSQNAITHYTLVRIRNVETNTVFTMKINVFPDDAPADLLLGTDMMDKLKLALLHGEERKIYQDNGDNKFSLFAIAESSSDYLRRVMALSSAAEKFKKELDELLKEHESSMPADPTTVKGFAKVKPIHVETTPDAVPSFQTTNNYSRKHRDAIRKWITDYLAWDKLEIAPDDQSGPPRQKGWNSVVMIVEDDARDMRTVFNAVNVNRHLLKKLGSLPSIKEIIEWAAKHKYLSKTDISKGFWSLLLDPESRKLFRFVFEGKQYQCRALPQGATISPMVFQEMMEDVFKDIPNIRIYIDDIIIATNTLEEHIATLRKLLARVKEVGLLLNRKKSIFMQEKVEMFGFDVSHGMISPAARRASAMAKYPVPTNPSELSRFVKSAGYFRDLVDHFATDEAVLNPCIKSWNWTPECKKSFESLREKLAALPYVVPYDEANKIELHVDTSKSVIGAVLLQVLPNGTKAPIWYYSSMLSDVERRYLPFHREFFGVVKAIRKFHPILHGIYFDLYVDHKPLVPVLNKPDKGLAQLGYRWGARVLSLMDYEFKTHWIAGEKHVVPDAFSRISPSVAALKVTVTSVKEAQNFDNEVKNLRGSTKQFYEQDGVLFRRGRQGQRQLVLPGVLRKPALEDAHFGHCGSRKMLSLLHSWCWWPRMESSIEEYLAGCEPCQNRIRHKQAVPESLHISKNGIWQDLVADFTGPLPDGSHILFVLDLFTMYLETKIVSGPTAAVATEFFEELFWKYGTPKTVLTDNGAAFIARAIKEAFERMGVKGRHSSPYTPQAHGPIERVVREIKEYLRALGVEKKNLKVNLQKATATHNATVHSKTGYSPFSMTFVRDWVSPLASLLRKPEETAPRESVQQRVTSQQNILLNAKHNIANKEFQQDKYLHRSGKIQPDRKFEIGDLVKLYQEDAKGKMEPKYTGPFTVIAKSSPFTYLLRAPDGKILHKISIRRLIGYNEPKPHHPVELDEQPSASTAHRPELAQPNAETPPTSEAPPPDNFTKIPLATNLFNIPTIDYGTFEDDDDAAPQPA
ncbi:MAG: reverse transcriptase domain-containing protein, partial [Candidatus Nanopelagicaceae bacterium]